MISEDKWSLKGNDDSRAANKEFDDDEAKGQNSEELEGIKEEISPDGDEHMSIEEEVEFMREQIMGLNEEIAELKASDENGTDQSGTGEGLKKVKNRVSWPHSEETTWKEAGKQVSSSRDSSGLYSDFANIVDGKIESGVANTVMKRRRARFLSGRLFGEARPNEEIDLETDIYSLFIISRNWGPSFFFSLTVAFSQFVITALILTDLVHRHHTIVEGIPPNVGWGVVLTQCFTLVIAFVSVDDMMVSLKMLVIGYDKDIGIENPAASFFKFLIANIIRFCEGFCTVTVCVVIIIQSSEVLELFMNFAAVAFVSELDNMAFELAEDGFLGDSLKTQCEKVLTRKVKVQRSARFGLINLIFILFFCPFLSVFVVVRVRQMNGTYLGQYACEHLDVRFGEEILVFDDDVRFSFVGEGFNKTFANSIRTLPQVDETPAGLPYQFFAGNYFAEKNDFDRLELYNERPIYWETTKNPEDHLRGTRGKVLKDPTSGKFYYCGSKSSWVFTIEALFDTPGVMPQRARDECEWGWLMVSPPTQARILNDAPTEGWSIWTGSIEMSTPEFSIACTDCTRDEDCGLTHGFCDLESRTCNCTDDWQGSRCEAERPFCPGITWVNEGDSSREYSELRPISSLWNASVYYDRPLYLSPITTEQNVGIWTIYAGRCWFVTHFEAHHSSIVSNHPHAYWDNILTTRAVRYSDPTTAHCPTGLRWNEIERPRSTGNPGSFGSSFGASFPSKGRYECIQVDCMNDSEEVCGRYGTCVTRNELVNGVEGPYNRCECANFTGGYFCEHHPDQPYSRDMYNEYIANPAYYRKINPNEEYLKFWVNETVKAAVDVIDEGVFRDRTSQYDYREL